MPKKLKEWHLRRENGIWRVYRMIHDGTIEWCIASAPELSAAIKLGKHYYDDLVKMEAIIVSRAAHI